MRMHHYKLDKLELVEKKSEKTRFFYVLSRPPYLQILAAPLPRVAGSPQRSGQLRLPPCTTTLSFPLSENLSAASVRISPHARANSLLLFIAT
jgi:hypothetical protein